MEDYPDELRTPPVALVALVGMPELHTQISKFLHTEQPPINTLALPDFSKLPVIGGKERLPIDARIPPPLGILKADWLHNHRTRVPAVLVVLFDREQVNGDPAQWLQVCTHIDNIKDVIRGRNTKLILAIVQPTLHGETNDERMTALRKRAEVDSKSCLTFISHDPTEWKRSLARLGSVLGELSGAYYKEESRRAKARLDKKNWSSTDTAVRLNFKMGYYSEFRRDWVAALRFYETAYTLLQEVLNTAQTVQRVVEVKAVAEQLHFKVSMLLIHGGKETEAVKWFKQHMTRYKRFVGPSEGGFLHLGWVSHQYHVFGDLLKTSISTASAPTAIPSSGISERELFPGFYYQIAAAYMTERRLNFERAFATFESFDDPDAVDILAGGSEETGPPLYVGQAPRILSRPPDRQSPTPDEYLRHAMLTERQFSHTSAAIGLLTKANEQYKRIHAARMTYFIGTEMGREYFYAGEYENAKTMFDSVVGIYRKEGWVSLLAASLGYLRESSRNLSLLKEYVEYSLELAALPDEGGRSTKQRVDVHNDVVAILQGAQNDPIALEIDQVSPLRGVLSICVAFHEQAVKPGASASLTISLLAHLPLPLELTELEIQFNQSSCNLVLKQSANNDLRLEPNEWKRLEVNIIAGKSGKLDCLSALARIGPNATILCQVESPASREPDALWGFEQRLDSFPVKDICLAFLGQKVIQVEEPEAKVEIKLDVGGLALLGEMFPVKIRVKSRGHIINSGELQVSLAEVTTSNDFAPPTPVSSHIAAAKVLYGAKLETGKGEALLWEVQGSMKVPYTAAEGEWTTTIYIQWTEPRPVSLLIALGYRTQDEEDYLLWVHRDFQLNCEDGLGINCRYIGPFQRDTLLPASLHKPGMTVLPLNETSTMVVTAKNISSLPVVVYPVQVEERNPGACQVAHMKQSTEAIKLLPGEVFNQMLTVRPLSASTSLDIGVLALKWEREEHETKHEVPTISTISNVMNLTGVTDPVSILQSITTTRVALPLVSVEKGPLIISLQRPPFGLLSVPFTLSFKIENKTSAVQEVKFSLVDAQSFLVSGASRGVISILPASTDMVSLRLVPIACGKQQLPQVMLTSVQYNASYQPPVTSAELYVFPSQPELRPRADKGDSLLFY